MSEKVEVEKVEDPM